MFKKKEIKFNSKLREFDRNYEKNNNGEVDNGVYIECEYSNYSMNLPEHRKESINEETRNSKAKMNENKKMSSMIDPMKKIEISDLGISEIDMDLISRIETFGYPKNYIINCLLKNEMNHCTATYYLMKE